MPSSRRFKLLAALIVLLVLALAGWSALWFTARDRVEAEIDRALAREARAGRQIACAERTLAGFPFRIEMTCARPLFAQSRGQLLEVTAARLTAHAVVWQPRRVRIDITGPLRVAEPGPGGREIAEVAFSAATAEALYDWSGRHGLTASAQNIAIRLASAAEPYRSPHAELVMRRKAQDGDGGHPVEITTAVSRLEGPLQLPGIHGAIDLDAELTVSGLDRVHGATQAERLRSWAGAGGRAEIARLRVLSPGAASETSGTLALDTRGRVNGALKVLVHGIDQMLGDLIERRLMPREMMTMVPTLAALSQKGDIDGRPAMVLPVNLREGLIRIGPMPVGALPPVF
ncbi:DUF2125 domain-containing protein [Blastochloris tepida]|uniref:DUF2125 domain-containing protein n=1 Tax=Blastochloris tepida TaxID=2233851 RepID=A0A348G5D0_9HYPH|nr:DUF2125 domain-containing protein [Blastochloris tepida]BBF94763.1 hypothetical protein BLTE_34480 [Blastochloris tepida]